MLFYNRLLRISCLLILMVLLSCTTTAPLSSPKTISFAHTESLGGAIDFAYKLLPPSTTTGYTYISHAVQTDRYTLMVIPQYPNTTVSLHAISYTKDYKSQTDPLPFLEQNLPEKTAFILYMELPETTPKLVLCLTKESKKKCWTPRFNGKSEGLLLNDGFEQIPLPQAWKTTD